MKEQSMLVAFTALCLGWLMTTASAAEGGRSYESLKASRIDEIAKMLPEKPAGLGRSITDRAFWEDKDIQESLKREIETAEGLLSKTLPAWSDDLYLEFKRTGKRPAGEKMMGDRYSWYCPLVLAECAENKGRFVPLINRVLREYMKDPTWVMPAHDRDLVSFKRKAYFVDLRVADIAGDFAHTLYLLGDRVEPEVRADMMKALYERVFNPLQESFVTENVRRTNWWLTRKNNWNAVCLAGVTGAAVAVIPDRHERAVFVAAAEHYSKYYIASFSDDGYCAEGLGYWNYGFSRFIRLREVMLLATGGAVDPFDTPKIMNIALFPERIEIFPNNAPAYGDCRFMTKPSRVNVDYCKRALGISKPQDSLSGSIRPFGRRLVETMMGFSYSKRPADAKDGGKKRIEHDPLRHYFKDKGILVSRPTPGSACRIGVSIKAGGNDSHSHDDVGSFAIALGSEQPVADPGGPHAYQKDMSGWKSKNSFGHPVPLVAGTLQINARRARPKVLKTEFTDTQDVFVVDITSSYKIPELKKLVREMIYDRTGSGFVTITDTFEFSSPQSFEEGLPTHGTFKQTGEDALAFTMGEETLLVKISTPDGFEVLSEVIEENAPPFTRVGVRLKKPVTKGTVTMTFVEVK
jgi:hypothetical protein